jgi:hypothetical protein
MADKYWIGGYSNRTGDSAQNDDGNWEQDDSGGGNTDSNWVNSSGVGVAKPVSGDNVYITELAGRVPANFSDATFPHVIGKHWSICVNLDQGAIDLAKLQVTSNYEGNIYGLLLATINDAEAAVDKGDGTVGIPIDGHPFAAGDYITFAGTDYFDGEFRVVSETTDEVVITATYIPETFSSTDTATGKRPLRIGIQIGGQMIIEGDETYYIECGDTHPYIPETFFNSSTGYLHLSSETLGADFTDVKVQGGGTLVVADDTYIGTVTVMGGSTATVIGGKNMLADSHKVPTDLNINGGTVTWDSEVNDIVQSGGTINFCPNVDIDTDVNISSFTGYNGEFNWYGKSQLSDYVNYGVDFTALGDGAKTFGSAAASYSHYDGTLDLSQPTGFVSLYASADIDNQGGVFLPPKRENVSW